MIDMLSSAAANLGDDGTSCDRRWHRAPAAPQDDPEMQIGLNWHILRVGDRDIVWHNGGTGGYRTWLGFDKQKGLAAVVLTNSAHGADDLGFELLK